MIRLHTILLPAVVGSNAKPVRSTQPRRGALQLLCALFVCTGITVGQTSVAVNPPTTALMTSDSVTLSIVVNNVANLHAVSTVLTFDNAIVQCYAVANGPFLGTSGQSVFFNASPAPNPSANSITIDQAILGFAAVSGSGVLYTIKFRAVGGGTSPISISSVDMRDLSNNQLPCTVAPGTISVNLTSTITSLTSSPNPSTFGQDVTLSSAVTPSGASGIVTFYDGVTSLGTGTLNGGVATLNISTLAVGTHANMTAIYGGDGSFSGSTSPLHSHTVTASTVTNQYSVDAAWNIISLPLAVLDSASTAVFPTAISSAYAYEFGSGYVPRTILDHGVGYWLKFPSAQNVSITGFLRTVDTIVVHAGWNMIGCISSPVHKDSILQIPAGIVASPYFKFAGSYLQVDTLLPARGYWVKVGQGGRLVLR